MENKKYLVIMQDEWNNLTYLGEYKKLADAIPDINNFLSIYDVAITADDLKEYPSTFGMVFDTNIGDLFEDNEEVYGIMIRGFILDE